MREARAGRGRLPEGRSRRQGAVPRSGLALLLVVVGLAGAACLGPVQGLYPPPPGEAPITVHVVRHGWHSGLVIRRDLIPRGAWPEHDGFPGARFLEVGWGDRAFYQSPDAGIALALEASFASGGSVLQVTGLDRPPAAAGCPITPAWALTGGNLAFQARRCGRY